jgi:hypothetical protein
MRAYEYPTPAERAYAALTDEEETLLLRRVFAEFGRFGVRFTDPND